MPRPAPCRSAVATAKPATIGQRRGGAEFAAMGVAVEQREGADQERPGRGRQPHRHGHDEAEGDDRGEDRRLDEGQPMPASASAKPTAIVPTKAAGTSDERPPAEHRRPEADRDHREDVVEAEQRMGDAGQERAVLAGADARCGERRASAVASARSSQLSDVRLRSTWRRIRSRRCRPIVVSGSGGGR